MMKRDVGSKAESAFLNWCGDDIRIAANKAAVDRKGWDFIVQFPRQVLAGPEISLDVQPPELTCLVQCKGTDGDISFLDVELSNWLHFVDAPLPTFYLIVAFGGQTNAQDAYLVHVGELWTERVLKRLSKCPPGTKLNHKQMRLKWSASDALSELSGRGLREAIEKYIEKDMESYVVEKIRRRKTLGYDERPYQVSIRMIAESRSELMTRLVDFAIGVVDKVPIVGLAVAEERFGILGPKREETFARSDLSLVDRTPDRIVSIRFRDATGAQSILLKDAAIYHPNSIFPFVDAEHIRVRIVTDLVDLVVQYSTHKVTLDFNDSPLTVPYPVSRLARFGRLAEVMLAGSENGLVIDIIGPEGELVAVGRTAPGMIVPSVLKHATQVRDAVWLCKYLDIDQDAMVTPAQLVEQETKFTLIRALVEQPLAFGMESGVDGAAYNPDAVATIGAVLSDRVEIGDWTVHVYVAMAGSDIQSKPGDGTQVILMPNDVTVVKHEFRVVHRNEPSGERDSVLIQRLRDLLQEQVDWVLPHTS